MAGKGEKLNAAITWPALSHRAISPAAVNYGKSGKCQTSTGRIAAFLEGADMAAFPASFRTAALLLIGCNSKEPAVRDYFFVQDMVRASSQSTRFLQFAGLGQLVN